MTKATRKVSIPALTPADSAALIQRIDDVCRGYKGLIGELENAVGMMFTGRLFGWKVLVLVHNKRTIRKYEEILGIDVREAFPEEGPLAHKSLGHEFVQKAGNFWKAVSGDMKVPARRGIDR